MADRYAGWGHAALVPNLFWRSEIPGAISYDDPQHAKAWARLKALDLDVVSADMRAATEWLRAQPFSQGKVAAIGFCGGGRFAFLAAVRCGADAAAALYGLGISQHLGEIGNARGPVQLHYGLQDQHVPRDEIDAVAAGLRGRANVEVFLYPEAGHSFANPVRPTYDAAAAKLANERIDAMLGKSFEDVEKTIDVSGCRLDRPLIVGRKRRIEEARGLRRGKLISDVAVARRRRRRRPCRSRISGMCSSRRP